MGMQMRKDEAWVGTTRRPASERTPDRTATSARRRGKPVPAPKWWKQPWKRGSEEDPDSGWHAAGTDESHLWQRHDPADSPLSDEAILAPLEEEFGQVRSRDRVRDLAEVFTHQREVDAMLDLIPDAFGGLDVKFLEPTCGSGNFLVEILRRKLRLVQQSKCVSQEQYEHQLLRAVASIYGVDISPENVTEARARMAHVLLSHYQTDANTIAPTTGFLAAAAVIIGDNIVAGDTLNAADQVELCDWRPAPGGCFQRVWSQALVPPADRDLFWQERIQDQQPVHFSQLSARATKVPAKKGRAKR